MPIIHFLNVKNGGCSMIQHYSGRTTVIDVCNAKAITEKIEVAIEESIRKAFAAVEKGVNGNFNQKEYPVNPILYLQQHGITDLFRFILTHSDCDHLDGIKALFTAFPPTNFWDTENKDEKSFDDGANGGYAEEDWEFYKTLRDGKPQSDPKRLTLYSGVSGQYYNQGDTPNASGDGLHILAPTKELIVAANELGDYNDGSYVILYRTGDHKILFAGDSHDATWDHILAKHKDFVTNVDLLIAPHHGRHSDRGWEFLDVVNPALTLFGNANCEHLAYSAWSSRGLPIMTNNQAGTVVINAETDPMKVYVTCQAFAKASNEYTFFEDSMKAYFWGFVTRKAAAVA